MTTPSALDDRRRLQAMYLPPSDDFVIVDVPDLQFVMLDGQGDPSGEAFAQANRWMWSVVYPMQRVARERMGRQYVSAPLEGLWWSDDMTDFVEGRRDRYRWRLMIVTADWVDQDLFDESLTKAAKRLGEPPESLRLERYHEGLSVQIMHLGPFSQESETIRRLHAEFIPAHGLVENGHHHEIYLNDPRRVAPEKLRTVIRQPVRRAS